MVLSPALTMCSAVLRHKSPMVSSSFTASGRLGAEQRLDLDTISIIPKGFTQVIVGARIKADNLVVFGALGGGNYDRQTGRCGAFDPQLFEYRRPSSPGKHYVKKHYLGRFFRKSQNSLPSAKPLASNPDALRAYIIRSRIPGIVFDTIYHTKYFLSFFTSS